MRSDAVASTTSSEAGFLTPVFGVVAVALSLISLASLQLARNDQVAERRSLERLQEHYRADGAAVIAVWRIVHETEPGVLKWRETVAGQSFTIVVEPETRKLALNEAGGLRGRARLRAALGEQAGDRLSIRLMDLAAQAEGPPPSKTLQALDRETAWRACGRSLVSPYSRLTDYALTGPRKPTTGPYGPRAGETWRILVANDRRVLIDRVVRMTGEVRAPAAVIDDASGEAASLSPLGCAEKLNATKG